MAGCARLHALHTRKTGARKGAPPRSLAHLRNALRRHARCLLTRLKDGASSRKEGFARAIELSGVRVNRGWKREAQILALRGGRPHVMGSHLATGRRGDGPSCRHWRQWRQRVRCGGREALPGRAEGHGPAAPAAAAAARRGRNF